MALIVYNPADNGHVAAIIQWWSTLSESDRDLVFHPTLHPLASFLGYFNERRAHLLFALDAQGLSLAAWSEPFWDGAEFAVWVRADQRHKKSVWKDLELAYRMALEAYPVLYGYTRQPQLHAAHLKLGYEYAGKLPLAWGGRPVWIYALTREGWVNRQKAAAEVRGRRRSLRPAAERNGVVHAGEAPEVVAGRGMDLSEHENAEQQPWMQRAFKRLLS